MSGAFLADIKPQTDGCNGLKYNLTPDIIESIFKTYPAVKRKHTEYVPTKLSEAEFWTKFFQSHYFHRDRIHTGTKDLFTECAKIDDQILKVAVEKSSGDPLLDVRNFDDNPLDESYGSSDKNIVNSGNIVHQCMIKRFNQHSFMVLKTCTSDNLSSISSSSTSSNSNNINNHMNNNNTNNNNNNKSIDSVDNVHNLTNGIKTKHKSQNNDLHQNNNNNNGIEDDVQHISPKMKKARLLEKIHLDDLVEEGKKTKKIPQLSLTKVCFIIFFSIKYFKSEST